MSKNFKKKSHKMNQNEAAQSPKKLGAEFLKANKDVKRKKNKIFVDEFTVNKNTAKIKHCL